jgi:hypothetical protein
VHSSIVGVLGTGVFFPFRASIAMDALHPPGWVSASEGIRWYPLLFTFASGPLVCETCEYLEKKCTIFGKRRLATVRPSSIQCSEFS